jgi:hypothetical protein
MLGKNSKQLDEDRVHEGHNNVVTHDVDDIVNCNEDTSTKITDDDVVVQQGATTVTFVVGEMHMLWGQLSQKRTFHNNAPIGWSVWG